MNTYTKSPYKNIPEELKTKYSMNGKIPIFDWYLDGSKDLHEKNWTDDYIETFTSRYTVKNILNNKEGKNPYGHESSLGLLNAFLKYNITNLNVAVIGTTSPWIEAILLNLNNKVTTVEYNVPITNYPNLKCVNYFDHFQKNNEIYDCIVTFSSIEHSGLGRYGDPLDPDGDLKTMEDIYNNLKDNGIVIWGAPIGKDAVAWNAHRVYGPMRLPIMFNKFKELDWYIYSKQQLFNQPVRKYGYQPVVVLRKKQN